MNRSPSSGRPPRSSRWLASAGFALSSRSPGPTTGTTTNQTSSPAAPSATADATELTKTYNSGQHGYSIRYPDGWTVTPAAATWLVGKVTNWGSPALDVIEGADTRLVASSQPLATGQSPEAWYQAVLRRRSGGHQRLP